MAILQGAIWGPNDPDSRAYDKHNWCWSIPLGFQDDTPDEESARLQFEGTTFSELVRNATQGLRYAGWHGRAYMSSTCWRYDYAEIAIDEDGVATCDTTPETTLMLEQMGELGE
jgi:hypothetical protein